MDDKFERITIADLKPAAGLPEVGTYGLRSIIVPGIELMRNALAIVSALVLGLALCSAIGIGMGKIVNYLV